MRKSATRAAPPLRAWRAPEYLAPNTHLLSWGSTVSLLSSTNKHGARARPSRPATSISSSALAAAAAALESGNRRGNDAYSRIDFYESSSKRCLLCGTILSGSYAAHESHVEHVARAAIVERAIALLLHYLENPTTSDVDTLDRATVASWTSEAVVSWLDAHWWRLLNPLTGATTALETDLALTPFHRLPTLSADRQQQRMQRLRFLLGTLKDVGVLRFSFMATGGSTVTPAPGAPKGCTSSDSSTSQETTGYSRTDLFQRFEMIGDNVMKVLMPDRLQAMFPFSEGGVDPGLQIIQRLLDSNQGLLDIYDALQLDRLVGTHLANSKAKSDVVEALLGELQTFLWATDGQSASGECVPAVPSRSLQRIRAVAEHTLHELMHVLMMWCVNEAVRNVFPLISASILQSFARQQQRNILRQYPGRSPAVDEAVADAMASAYEDEVIGRGARQALLPLLSPKSSAHFLTARLWDHQAWWHYNSSAAPTEASADQRGPQQLSRTPCSRPDALTNHYACKPCRPSHSVHELVWSHRTTDSVTIAPLSATPVKKPALRAETTQDLAWELLDSYPWGAR